VRAAARDAAKRFEAAGDRRGRPAARHPTAPRACQFLSRAWPVYSSETDEGRPVPSFSARRKPSGAARGKKWSGFVRLSWSVVDVAFDGITDFRAHRLAGRSELRSSPTTRLADLALADRPVGDVETLAAAKVLDKEGGLGPLALSQGAQAEGVSACDRWRGSAGLPLVDVLYAGPD